ncbi:MAG: PadR family transcriptional regulator [Clostridiales bacterium]|nr:PadR family transcriptional regulator [Clostridiales bacterium]
MLDYIILGVLCSDSLSGYDIRKCIEHGIGMFYKASYGSIYPILTKLTKEGCVSCEEEKGMKKRKVYTIQPKGKEKFQEWLKDLEETGGSIETFMAKVFFFDQLPYETVVKQIDTYEKSLKDYLNVLLEKKKQFEGLKNQDDFYYKLSTLYFGICKLQSIILWCQTVKEKAPLQELIQPMK